VPSVYDTDMITALMLLPSSHQIQDDELTHSWPFPGGLAQSANPGSVGDRDDSPGMIVHGMVRLLLLN